MYIFYSDFNIFYYFVLHVIHFLLHTKICPAVHCRTQRPVNRPLHMIAFLIIDVFVRHVVIYNVPDRFSRWWPRSPKRSINITNFNQYIFLRVQLWSDSIENKIYNLTTNQVPIRKLRIQSNYYRVHSVI